MDRNEMAQIMLEHGGIFEALDKIPRHAARYDLVRLAYHVQAWHRDRLGVELFMLLLATPEGRDENAKVEADGI